MVSFNKSYLDLILNEEETGGAMPNYSDAQGKLKYNINDNNKLTLINVFSIDDINLTYENAIETNVTNVYGSTNGFTNTGQRYLPLVTAPGLLEMVFAQAEGRNTERFGEDETTWLARVDSIVPERLPEFEEVRDTLEAAWRAHLSFPDKVVRLLVWARRWRTNIPLHALSSTKLMKRSVKPSQVLCAKGQ